MTRVKSLATAILNPWHLAPAGQTSCDYGSPATQNECEKAVAALASKAGTKPGRGIQYGSSGSCNDGGWGNIPLGCTSQTGGDWAAHYKTSDAVCNPGSVSYSLVCSVPWHLAPAGQTSCDYGSPATQNECEKAVAALASKAGTKPGRGIQYGSSGSCYEGGWGNIPLGCNAQTGGDWAAHYKTSGANCNSGNVAYSLVCSLANRSPSFLFEKGNELLCDQLLQQFHRFDEELSVQGKWQGGSVTGVCRGWGSNKVRSMIVHYIVWAD